jgi:hypothetical protein
MKRNLIRIAKRERRITLIWQIQERKRIGNKKHEKRSIPYSARKMKEK